jgi:hypothetical protein
MTKPTIDAKELVERSGLKDQLAAAGYSVEDNRYLLGNVAGPLRYRLHHLGMPWTEDERRLTEARDRLYRLRPWNESLDAFLNRLCDAIENDPQKFAAAKKDKPVKLTRAAEDMTGMAPDERLRKEEVLEDVESHWSDELE